MLSIFFMSMFFVEKNGFIGDFKPYLFINNIVPTSWSTSWLLNCFVLKTSVYKTIEMWTSWPTSWHYVYRKIGLYFIELIWMIDLFAFCKRITTQCAEIIFIGTYLFYAQLLARYIFKISMQQKYIFCENAGGIYYLIIL